MNYFCNSTNNDVPVGVASNSLQLVTYILFNVVTQVDEEVVLFLFRELTFTMKLLFISQFILQVN